MNLTLRKQIFLSYIVMIMFTLIVGVYATWNFKELNVITNEIILGDLAISENLTKLNDCILAQDLHEKRYLTFQLAESESLFWNRSREFKSLLIETGNLSGGLKTPLENLNALHDNYDQLFIEESSL